MADDFKFSVNSLEFNDIAQQLADYYKSIGYEYTDGSNFSLLNSALAFTNMMDAYYITNTISNLYLDSSNTKEATYSLASQISYIPRRMIPSKSKVTAIYTPETFSGTTFQLSTIEFIGKNNGFKYVSNNVVFNKNTDGTYSSTFIIENKELQTIEYLGNNSINQFITLPDINITHDDFVINSTITNSTYEWTLVNNFAEIPDSNSRIYYININKNEEVKIIFGNGDIGQVPQSTEKLQINYYTTDGIDANNETEFQIVKILSNEGVEFNNIGNYSFTNFESFGGRDVETLEEIKRIAPKYFSSLGNSIIQHDFKALVNIADYYVAHSNLATVDYNTGNLLGTTYLALVPSNYRTEDPNKVSEYYPNGTMPIDEITTLVPTSDTYTNIRQFYNGWAYIGLISPTYFYIDINPYIEIVSNGNYDVISKNVFESMLDYVSEDNVDSSTDLFGFNKIYRDSILYKLINQNSGVVSSEVITNFNILTDKLNILDKYFLKMPNDFLMTNQQNFDNLKTLADYPYSSLLLEDSTVYCKDLEQSALTNGIQFDRFLVNSDSVIINKFENLFDMKFDSDGNIIDQNINNIYINNKLVTLKVFKYDGNNGKETFANGYVPLLYTTERIQDAITDVTYNFDEYVDNYFVYFTYAGVSYLIGEILRLDEPDTNYVFKKVDNTYAIQIVFGLLGISKFSNTDFLDYTFDKSLNYNGNVIEKEYNINGNMIFDDVSTLKRSEMTLKTTSRKKIFDIKLTTIPQITNNDSDVFSYVLNTDNETITINDKSDGLGNDVLVLSYNNFELNIISTSNYSSDVDLDTYKDNKFNIEISNNDYSIYCYEDIDDTNMATIDVENGIFYFNKSVIYYPDVNVNTNISITLENMLDILFDDNTIYYMKLISKNDIANINNINESFDTDDTIFVLPNLNHVRLLNA